MLKSEIKNIVEKPTWVLLIAVSAFYLIGLYLFSHFVWSTDIYEYNYKAETGFENYIDMIRRIDFVRYIFSPLYISSISLVITGLIQIGLKGNNIELNNKLLFNIILVGTVILSLPLWVKTVWFVLIRGNYTMEEVKFFYPFSLLYFFEPADLHIKLVKALGKLNLYHFAFILFVASSLKIYSDAAWGRILGIVCYTYGLGFLLLQSMIILIFI